MMAPTMTDRIEGIYSDAVRRNSGELEFHQAVREVLGCLGPVLVKHPEFGKYKIIERILEPERQIIFRVLGKTIRGRSTSTVGFESSLTPPLGLIRGGCAFTLP